MKEARKPKCPADCKGPFENTACEYTCHNNNKDKIQNLYIYAETY